MDAAASSQNDFRRYLVSRVWKLILNVGGCDGNHYDGWRKGVTVSGHGASVDQEPVAGHRRWSGVWLQELVTSHLVHSRVQLQHQGFNMSFVQFYNFDIFLHRYCSNNIPRLLPHAHSTCCSASSVCANLCMVSTSMWETLVFFLWMSLCPCHFMLYFFQANIAICWSDALDVDVNTMQCQCCDLIFNT